MQLIYRTKSKRITNNT